jgi:hypothetical protein
VSRSHGKSVAKKIRERIRRTWRIVDGGLFHNSRPRYPPASKRNEGERGSKRGSRRAIESRILSEVQLGRVRRIMSHVGGVSCEPEM